jgi:ubiquinol-cytochrome c reductase cytochrome c subunit
MPLRSVVAAVLVALAAVPPLLGPPLLGPPLLGVVVAVAGAGPAAGAGGGSDGPLPPDAGRQLYLRDCAWCHGPEGGGSAVAPAIAPAGAAGARFMVATGRMPISRPDELPRRSPPRYSPAEIDAIAATVGSFGSGPPVPEVDPAAGDLTRGGELYRLHCAPCHSATGIGGALAYGPYAPAVLPATPTEVAEAMLIGPGAMPTFPAFDEHEVASIARYVRYLAEPEAPGGASLGRSGRVEEGLVAWAVGLAGLALGARWIARRGGP